MGYIWIYYRFKRGLRWRSGGGYLRGSTAQPEDKVKTGHLLGVVSDPSTGGLGPFGSRVGAASRHPGGRGVTGQAIDHGSASRRRFTGWARVHPGGPIRSRRFKLFGKAASVRGAGLLGPRSGPRSSFTLRRQKGPVSTPGSWTPDVKTFRVGVDTHLEELFRGPRPRAGVLPGGRPPRFTVRPDRGCSRTARVRRLSDGGLCAQQAADGTSGLFEFFLVDGRRYSRRGMCFWKARARPERYCTGHAWLKQGLWNLGLGDSRFFLVRGASDFSEGPGAHRRGRPNNRRGGERGSSS